jgi:hypothetical protein
LGQALGAGAGDDPRRQAGEAGDLLLPLPLERGWADDEHALDAAQAPEELAGGDGLDGLAEAHLVRQQGPLGEGQMEHALPLVGIEGDPHHVQRGPAGLDVGEEALSRLLPRGFAAFLLDPGEEVPGEPDSRPHS